MRAFTCHWCNKKEEVANWQYLANEGWTFQAYDVTFTPFYFCSESHKDAWLAAMRKEFSHFTRIKFLGTTESGLELKYR